MGGTLRFLTQDEYNTERNRAQSSFDEKAAKRGNPIAGIVGALLGSLVGVLAMVIIGQLGYVSVWAGLVMGVCVAKGYELLSGKFDFVGLVCSLLVMAVMVYFGNQLDWAITIARAYEANVFDAFPVVNEVVKANELLPVYYRNLGLYYLATLIGAIPTLIGLLKHQQLLTVSYPIGPEAHESVVYVSSDDVRTCGCCFLFFVDSPPLSLSRTSVRHFSLYFPGAISSRRTSPMSPSIHMLRSESSEGQKASP